MDAERLGSGIACMHTALAAIRDARHDPGLALLLGFHPLKHALLFGAEILTAVSADSPRVERLAAELAPELGPRLARLVVGVAGAELERVAGREAAASDVIAVARRPPFDPAHLLAPAGIGPIVLLERPTHAGNLGAVVRVAAAAGAAGVLTLGGGDPWQPLALKGSAGLHFALPVGALADLDAVSRDDLPLLALDPGGEQLVPGCLPRRALLAFGSERRGLSAAMRSASRRAFAIPMRAGVSSLNLATAVAVALYLGCGGSPSSPGGGERAG